MSKYPLTEVSVPPLSADNKSHMGTGDFSDKHRNVVVPASVGTNVNTQLDPVFQRYDITVMAFEIDHNVAPNWFGVAFRKGIDSFESVNIFCHPSPGEAKMWDSDYLARGGEWPKLFRYVEMLGSQIAMTASSSGMAPSNQILIVPFFNNASYLTGGVFRTNWKEIVDDIVTEVMTKVWTELSTHSTSRGGSTLKPPVAKSGSLLKNVVLSDFSLGRQLMWTIYNSAPGITGYVREIWDFDGTGPRVPCTTGALRAIRYDQSTVRDPSAFHVPAQRWVKYHGGVVPDWHAVHGDIPYMLAWHAATVSGVK